MAQVVSQVRLMDGPSHGGCCRGSEQDSEEGSYCQSQSQCLRRLAWVCRVVEDANGGEVAHWSADVILEKPVGVRFTLDGRQTTSKVSARQEHFKQCRRSMTPIKDLQGGR